MLISCSEGGVVEDPAGVAHVHPQRLARYHRLTAAWPPTSLLQDTVKSRLPFGRRALDLGCGSGRDSQFLARSGFSVTAIDIASEAAAYFTKMDSVEFLQADIEQLSLPTAAYDVVNAAFCLPFLRAAVVPRVIRHIKAALRPRGVFVGHLFGDRYVGIGRNSSLALFTRAELTAFFSTMNMLRLVE